MFMSLILFNNSMRRWLIVLAIIHLTGCMPHTPSDGGIATIALSSDPETLSPLFATGTNSSAVIYFLYPDLVEYDFNEITGRDTNLPSLANSWTISDDYSTVTYHLHTHAHWQDGKKITAHDFAYTYRLYFDPQIGSARRTRSDIVQTRDDGSIDWENVIRTPDDSTIVFHFKKNTPHHRMTEWAQQTPIPKHVLDTIPPSRIRTSWFNQKPVSGKHFILERWERKQNLILKRNSEWTIPDKAHLDQIVFRIIPDMTTRLIELQSGRVDVVEGVNPSDAAELRKQSRFRIERQSGRRVEFVGWNHIDPSPYISSGTIKPHKFFSDQRVRKALSYAIHRAEITQNWCGEYGQIASGPVSPVFRWAYNDQLPEMTYDPDSARIILQSAGWADHDGDGILDNNGKPFQFTLTTNTGNPRREFIAQKIQSDLLRIGIKIEIQMLETAAFNAALRERKLDAFITGYSVNMNLDLQPQFGSDLKKNTFNASGYQSAEADSLLNVIYNAADRYSVADAYRALQSVIYRDQPVTFLFWYDNLTVFNNRVRGTHADIYSPYHRFWEWYIEENP